MYLDNQVIISIFKEHKLGINQLLGTIPEALLSYLSVNTKAVKYSMAFDGVLPCLSEIFTASGYSSEDNALPKVVRHHVKEETNHKNIYLLDRGLQSTRNIHSFSKEQITFIARAKENRK